jgi:hypothetical protein
MDAGNSQSGNGWNMSFFEKRKLKLQSLQQTPKVYHEPLTSHAILSKILPTTYNQAPVEEPKKLSAEDVISKGRIVKIVEKTLNANEFKVQCEYES